MLLISNEYEVFPHILFNVFFCVHCIRMFVSVILIYMDIWAKLFNTWTQQITRKRKSCEMWHIDIMFTLYSAVYVVEVLVQIMDCCRAGWWLGIGQATRYFLNQWWLSMLGAVSIRKTVLPGMAIPMLKIRRPNGRLIFNMEIAIRR